MVNLKNKKQAALFGFVIIAIIFIASGITVDLPQIVDTIIEHYVTKIIILTALIAAGSKSLPAAIVIGVIYILLSERIINKEIGSIDFGRIGDILNINKPTEKKTEKKTETPIETPIETSIETPIETPIIKKSTPKKLKK